MENNETVNERRARENAARIAEHQRITARPRVAQHDDFFKESLTLHQRKEAANDALIAKVERAKQRDWYSRMYPGKPFPAEMREPNDAA